MAAASVAHLYGNGVPDEILHGVAQRHGFTLAPQGTHPAAGNGVAVLVSASMDGTAISQALSQPYQGYVELTSAEDQLTSTTLEGIGARKLCFSLTTSTAYTIDSAALVCDALAARGVLTPIRRPDVELALHESISNAVVHGNLGLESNMKGDVGNFAKFAQELQSRMVGPEARRRVDVIASWDHEFLDISIIDQGNGYDESKLPANMDPFAPAGRGLAIIRSLTLAMNVTHGGRVTTLRFLT